MVLVISGVSSVGKTTVSKLLADDLGWKFYDADDFHPQSNIDKMKSGIPLDDCDREPWLKNLRHLIRKSIAAGENAVLACSALKRKYRDELRGTDEVKFVFLRADRSRVSKQLRQRGGHFMNPKLLESQFAELEEPAPDEDAITIPVGDSPAEEVAQIKRRLGR